MVLGHADCGCDTVTEGTEMKRSNDNKDGRGHINNQSQDAQRHTLTHLTDRPLFQLHITYK